MKVIYHSPRSSIQNYVADDTLRIVRTDAIILEPQTTVQKQTVVRHDVDMSFPCNGSSGITRDLTAQNPRSTKKCICRKIIGFEFSRIRVFFRFILGSSCALVSWGRSVRVFLGLGGILASSTRSAQVQHKAPCICNSCGRMGDTVFYGSGGRRGGAE